MAKAVQFRHSGMEKNRARPVSHKDKIGPRKWKFFGVRDFFFVNFDFKNGCKNEFDDNNEKSCSRFKNRVPLKIDFRADWTHESIPIAWKLTTWVRGELIKNQNQVFRLQLFNYLPNISGFFGAKNFVWQKKSSHDIA